MSPVGTLRDAAIIVECAVEAGDWGEEEALFAFAEQALSAAADAMAEPPGGEVGVVFTDDAHIRKLNARWRGKDSATNVLSFPAGAQPEAEGPVPLGDIVLAFETVAREAAAEDKKPEHHVAHLLVHGFLHLLGYDHETDEQAETMEALERRILHALAIGDPYT